MTRRLRLAFVFALWLPALAARAEPVGYVGSFDQLFRVDFGTDQSTLIGNSIGFASVEGLAFAPNGTLYGISDATKQLVTINTATGKGTLVGFTGLAGQGIGQFDALDPGLAFTVDGRLWASSATVNKLWRLDPVTATATLVGATGAHISGLAGRGDELYGVGSNGNENLYRINTSTGAATLIGALFPGQSVHFDNAGADFDGNGVLWAVLDYSPTMPNRASDLVRINLDTGAATIVGQTHLDSDALAIAPPQAIVERQSIPALSPAAMAALALLLAGLVPFAPRRRRVR
jgi:hypothetical protein